LLLEGSHGHPGVDNSWSDSVSDMGRFDGLMPKNQHFYTIYCAVVPITFKPLQTSPVVVPFVMLVRTLAAGRSSWGSNPSTTCSGALPGPHEMNIQGKVTVMGCLKKNGYPNPVVYHGKAKT